MIPSWQTEVKNFVTYQLEGLSEVPEKNRYKAIELIKLSIQQKWGDSALTYANNNNLFDRNVVVHKADSPPTPQGSNTEKGTWSQVNDAVKPMMPAVDSDKSYEKKTEARTEYDPYKGHESMAMMEALSRPGILKGLLDSRKQLVERGASEDELSSIDLEIAECSTILNYPTVKAIVDQQPKEVEPEKPKGWFSWLGLE